MRKYFIQILFLLLIPICFKTVAAQPKWQQISVPFQDNYYVTYLLKDTNKLVIAGANQIKVVNGRSLALTESKCLVKTGGMTNNCKVNPFMLGSFRNDLILLSEQQVLTSVNEGELWNESGLGEFLKSWKKKNFTKPAERLNEVFFSRFSVTGEYIYLVGSKVKGGNQYGSVIFRSKDLTTWEDVNAGFPVKSSPKLIGLYFVDDFTGWAVGREGVVVKTDDAGKTWTAQSAKLGPTTTLNDVFFTDANNGWAVGDNGIVIATQDGGKNWNKQPTSARESLRRVRFINNSIGWAVGYKGTILFTSDGGRYWEEQNQGNEDLYNVYAVELLPDDLSLIDYHRTKEWLAYIVGAKGTILKKCSSGPVCLTNDISQIERDLSENAARVKKKDIEAGRYLVRQRIENNKANVKRLSQQLKKSKEWDDIDVNYVEDEDPSREAIRLSGSVEDDDSRARAVDFIRTGTDLQVIDNIKTKTRTRQIAEKQPDYGEYEYKALELRQTLNCGDVDIVYSPERVGIQKKNQSSPKYGNFTQRAADQEKMYANRCYTISEDRYLLSTQNGVYFSKKELLKVKWDLLTRVLRDQDLLIRSDAVAVTPTKIVILASIYENTTFVKNVVYVFDKSKLEQTEFEGELPKSTVEYTKIVFVRENRLEILSNKGKKMISVDGGSTWREDR